MALARKCDRCKKLFEPNLTWSGHTKAHVFIKVIVEANGAFVDKLYESDLCPECYEKLRQFMEMEGD